VGILKDFNHRPVNRIRYRYIEPLAFNMIDSASSFSKARYLSLKIYSGEIQDTISKIEAVWKKFSTDFPFVYSFLDERIENIYRAENRLSQSITYLTFIAIFIASIGLLGLISFTSEQKTKEIGIRKVLGASTLSIYSLLYKPFIKRMGVASIAAFPCAFYLMKNWLNAFVYRTKLSVNLFLLTLLTVLTITFITITFYVIKAALSNPVDILRYE
jgi:putative ABC transport system permease protein